MVIKKQVRAKGKIQLSKWFQSLKEGDSVAVVREPSVDAYFPERLQGRTGIVIGKRGRAYMVRIMENDKEKKFIIEPVHLKRIEQNQKIK